MILAAHQPHIMPWLGYLDKMAKADVFVLMDSLQYEHQNFQNRQRFKFQNGVQWLTVPVVRGSQSERIIDKKIDNSRNGKGHWQRIHRLTLESNYKKAPHYEELAKELDTLYNRPTPWENLIDFNSFTLCLARKWFGITTPLVRSSSLDLQGQKTDMIIDMCRKLGADTYLSGTGGSQGGYKGNESGTGYLDIQQLKDAGIEVIWQDFQHPEYSQLYPQHGFAPKLGCLDYVFNCGKEAAVELFAKNKESMEARI